MLINASWRLGEAIVSENVTPDRWIFDKKSRKFIEEKIAEKKKMTIRKYHGTGLIDVATKKCDKSSLDKNELPGQKAEDYFKLPQDIEWTCCNYKLFGTIRAESNA